ncbi:UBP1-associated protein 2C-like isoform X3 [Magnolia sinica]|uniref:UBP1-associated protein 2C-like isoform X3 n=1 Tax=Magnolia sinica TaxID=86752 RepID=UPI00265ADD49|nr:UBP1-associated protein 2C-like isoform X3 [Magnolia sinica]
MKLLLTKAPPPCFAALLSYARETMEDSKKRKLEETGNGQPSSLPSEEHLRLLLDPLRKDQLLDLLVKLGSQYPSVAEEIRGVASADPVHRKLFVRGLAWETTSETLCAAFAGHGEIEEGAVIVDKATGKSRGYGFITYRHMESTQMALREPSKLIDGRLAVCNLACEGLSSASVTTDQAQRKLYIGGLSPDVSSEILLNFFSRHGEIEEGSVAYDKETNKSRGFGFVTYKTLEAAKKALDDPNKVLGGRNITVKLADSQKAKVVQTQIPATMVPIAIPLPAGYAQPGKTHVVSTAPIGYSAYPQALAAYPAAYPGITPQYPPQSQVSYAQVAAKKDPVGLPAGVVLPAGAPAGISGYPYYAAKQ